MHTVSFPAPSDSMGVRAEGDLHAFALPVVETAAALPVGQACGPSLPTPHGTLSHILKMKIT